MNPLEGKVALVTGAGSGIGAAVVWALGRQGAATALIGRRVDSLARSAARTPRALVVQADVTDSREVDIAFEKTMERFGSIDIVVHCAAVDDPEAKLEIDRALASGRTPRVVASMSEERWNRMLATNLTGSFHVTRAALNAMSTPAGGVIILVGSVSGVVPTVGLAHYSAAKAGVHAFAQAVAAEASPAGIRVRVFAPGPTETEMTQSVPPTMRAHIEATSGFARPEDVAESILDLVLADPKDMRDVIVVDRAAAISASQVK